MERKNLQNFDEIKQRLLQFAESQKIPKGEFYEKISLFPSNFAGKGAESALKSDNIVKVLTEFPDLNSDWLLLGRGEMLRSQSTPQPSHDDFFTHLLAEKDKKIEALVRENERLSIDLQREREKSSSQLAPTAFV